MEASDPLQSDRTNSDDSGGDKESTPANDVVKTDTSSHRFRILRTISLYTCFLASGLTTEVLDATLTNMRFFLGTNMKSIVSAFSGGVIGWIGGSVLAGVFYERFNPELQMAIAALVIFVTTATAPWTGSLIGFVALMTVQGLGAGYIDASEQPYGLRLWAGHKAKEPVMQATAVFQSLGSALGPLIASPFLINVEQQEASSNITALNTTDTFNCSDAMPVGNTSDCTFYEFPTTTTIPFNREDMAVGYAYVILSFAGLIATCFMLVTYFLGGPSCKAKASVKAITKEENHTADLRFRLPFYIMLFLFYCLMMWICGLGHLLPALVVDGLQWDVKLGSLLSTVFYATYCIGQVLGIFLSTVFSPAQMLLMDISLAVVALGLMSSITFTSETIIWIAAALAGLAAATEFVSAILWSSQYVKFTGAVAALCITGMGTGGIVGVQIAGYLFDTNLHNFVIYLTALASIFQVVLFIAMYFFAESYVKRLPVEISDKETTKEHKPMIEMQQARRDAGNV